jgi:hypothetical protein
LLIANPFAVSSDPSSRAAVEASPAATVDAANQRRTTALEKVRVTAIMQSASGPAAMIGARLVRVGDILDPGLRIVHIDATGVEVTSD